MLGGLAIAMGSVLMAVAIFKKIGVAALLLNPVGWAIALLATAAFLLWKNWDGVVGGLKALWQSLGGNVVSVLGNIGKAILNWSPLGLFYKAFAAVLKWFGIDLPGNLVDGLVAGL